MLKCDKLPGWGQAKSRTLVTKKNNSRNDLIPKPRKQTSSPDWVWKRASYNGGCISTKGQEKERIGVTAGRCCVSVWWTLLCACVFVERVAKPVICLDAERRIRKKIIIFYLAALVSATGGGKSAICVVLILFFSLLREVYPFSCFTWFDLATPWHFKSEESAVQSAVWFQRERIWEISLYWVQNVMNQIFTLLFLFIFILFYSICRK